MTPTVPDVDAPRLGAQATTTNGAIDELLTVGDLARWFSTKPSVEAGNCHI